ncbi:olfactory receptor 1C1-like [Periophthalmus magnuspinnatus]|uniref:olfactory receptor 1C1-like n=1 Tax=Periophthalmus magnuspinnatus TaxID=409849 RepID=UPI00145A1861|nr:olfactory receptor 1C1-like [Periophthalmus magnuspinnatus]
MEFFNPATNNKNITFVRPPYFLITGLSGISNIKHYYVFLFIVYIVSVIGNSFVMAVIVLDHNLRTPKYIAVFNMAFVDLLGNTALVPKLLDIFLFNRPYIRYNDCMTYLFFCYTCLSMQSFNLAALAYDRLMAISYPLHYQVKVTTTFMLCLIGFLWLFIILAVLIAVGLITRLSFCQSVVINSYFCDHGQIYRLSCNDHFPNYVVSCLYPILIFWLPLAFILFSYVYIVFTLANVATVREGLRALKTCIGHLLLVAIYFIPLLIVFTLMEKIQPNARIINLSMTSVFPPMLNPIIYVLQTQEIKDSVKRLLHMRRKSKIEVRNMTTVRAKCECN